MSPLTFTDEAACLAATFQPQFDQLFRGMEPPMPGWAAQYDAWFALCAEAPTEAFREEALAGMLELLVHLMHARMSFAVAGRPRYGRPPEIAVTGDHGGAVLAAEARTAILRLALRHDREMACRLAKRTLRLIETQRRDIAEMIGARV